MNAFSMVVSVLASAGLVILGVAWLGGRAPRTRIGCAVLAVLGYGAVLWTRPDTLVLSNAAVLVAAICLAPLLARSLGSTGAIVAFAIAASLVDLFSFGGGLTRRIIQDYHSGGSDLLRFLAVTVPVSGRPTPLVGVVDLLIVGALFLALVGIHGARRRASLTLLGALAVAVVVGLVVGGVAAVPFLGFGAAADASMAGRSTRSG
jgi:hypothetical protein